MTHPLISRLLLGGLLILTLSACGARQPVTYYNLSALPPPQAASERDAKSTDGDLSLGLGPVTLPESLMRPQIALRLDDQRLRYDDFHRWSGSLAEDFAEVLLEDILAQLPAGTAAAIFPGPSYFDPSRRLALTVSRFDGGLGGEVVLKARWTISRDKTALVTRQSSIHIPSPGPGYGDLVMAQSQALRALATEIVGALAGQ